MTAGAGVVAEGDAEQDTATAHHSMDDAAAAHVEDSPSALQLLRPSLAACRRGRVRPPVSAPPGPAHVVGDAIASHSPATGDASGRPEAAPRRGRAAAGRPWRRRCASTRAL